MTFPRDVILLGARRRRGRGGSHYEFGLERDACDDDRDVEGDGDGLDDDQFGVHQLCSRGERGTPAVFEDLEAVYDLRVRQEDDSEVTATLCS